MKVIELPIDDPDFQIDNPGAVRRSDARVRVIDSTDGRVTLQCDGFLLEAEVDDVEAARKHATHFADVLAGWEVV